MPLNPADLPAEVQVAFFIFGMLPDNYAGQGDYIGKDWSCLDAVFDIYDIEDRKTTFFFMKMYERVLVEHISAETKKKIEAEKKKAKASAGPGKNYKYNVNG